LAVALAVSLIFAIGFVAVAASADETTPAAKTSAATGDESVLQKEARTIAQGVKLSAVVGGKEDQLELIDQPVLKYGDITRDNEHGSVWIWQRSGHPEAIMELYRGSGKKFWVLVTHSLSAHRLKGDLVGTGTLWAPREAGLQWTDLPQAPAPAEREAARLRQLKDLAQRFTAHEFWDPDNSRFELRLLVQPAYKYTSHGSSVIDGAVFLLCHENNPEVVLLIEAAPVPEAGPTFRYALTRMGHAELHVELDGREVWQKQRVGTTAPSDPYFLLVK
jgi:hypothetical protein